MKLPSLPGRPGLARFLSLQSQCGARLTLGGGQLIVAGMSAPVLALQIVARFKRVAGVERVIGAGFGAAAGMLAGPAGAVVGAGMGAALAGRKRLHVKIVDDLGRQYLVEIAPGRLNALELAANRVAR